MDGAFWGRERGVVLLLFKFVLFSQLWTRKSELAGLTPPKLCMAVPSDLHRDFGTGLLAVVWLWLWYTAVPCYLPYLIGIVALGRLEV